MVQVRGSRHISSVARERASILDTALLQAMILTGHSTGALELMRGPNYCDLKICEEFLLEKKCHALLLELYKGKQMHREALKLLVQLVQESSSNATDPMSTQKFMPDMVIEYLKVPFSPLSLSHTHTHPPPSHSLFPPNPLLAISHLPSLICSLRKYGSSGCHSAI